MSKRLATLESRRAELRQRLASVGSDLSRQREPLSADFTDQATQRVQDGKDGECAVCGTGIAAARLEAVPYTDRCSACAA
jgi:RNA polymerase-binding transcription factor DksA